MHLVLFFFVHVNQLHFIDLMQSIDAYMWKLKCNGFNNCCLFSVEMHLNLYIHGLSFQPMAPILLPTPIQTLGQSNRNVYNMC